jgi:hypothetical protein
MKRQVGEYLQLVSEDENVVENVSLSTDQFMSELLNDYRLSEMLERGDEFPNPVPAQKKNG